MSAKFYQRSPLSVLAVMNDSESVGPGMLSALRNHYTLICRSTRQAIDSAPSFSPAIVIVDLDLPKSGELVRRLSELPGLGNTVFIAFSCSESTVLAPAGFQHLLTAPIAARELEQLLTQTVQGLEADCPIIQSA